MNRTVRVLLLVAAAVLAAAPTGANAQGRRTLAELPNESAVTALGGLSVVSVFDAAAREYRLTLVRADGRQERLPVAASPMPFDADLGHDGAGRPAVVFSRCADPRKRAAGRCDLVIHVIGELAERPIANANTAGASEYEPTLWRGTVAWIRSFPGGGQAAYLRSLTAARSRRSVRQPGLPRRNCAALSGARGSCATRDRELTDLELDAGYLAFLGRYTVADDVQDLQLVNRRTNRARRVALLQAGEGGQTLLGLSFSGGRLGWQRSCFGASSGCTGKGTFRYRIARDTYELEPEYRTLSGFALIGDGALGVDGGPGLGDEPGSQFDSPCGFAPAGSPPPTCPLVRFQRLAWEPVEAERVR